MERTPIVYPCDDSVLLYFIMKISLSEKITWRFCGHKVVLYASKYVSIGGLVESSVVLSSVVFGIDIGIYE